MSETEHRTDKLLCVLFGFLNACQRLMLKLINCFPNHQLLKKNGNAIKNGYSAMRFSISKQFNDQNIRKYFRYICLVYSPSISLSPSSQLFLRCINFFFWLAHRRLYQHLCWNIFSAFTLEYKIFYTFGWWLFL